VIISRLFIGEVTGFLTNLSLIPIVLGLALCSSFELNFSAFGFFAAVLTNLTEW
jgi:solute carrier family 35 protein E2